MTDTPEPAPFDTEHSFFTFTTRRPVAVTMAVIAAVVFGFVGLSRLPVNLLPDISYPTVTIRTEYPGSSPEDVEERISERIQEAVSVVPGVQRVVSISRPGISDVVLEFTWGTEMVFAISDIRERLERVFLPAEADRPLVLRYDPSLDPMLTLGVSGDVEPVELRRIAEEEVERELAKLDGVAAVKVRGGDEEEILISIDEDAISVLGLDTASLGRRLAAENVNAASGSVEEGNTEFLVRTLGEFRNLEEIKNVIIERRNETPIRLRDIAEVRRLPKDKEVISRVDGVPCVLVDVYKEAGSNVVQVAERVRDRALGSGEQLGYVARTGGKLGPPTGPVDTADARMAEARRTALHRQMIDYVAFQLGVSNANIVVLQDQSRFIQGSINDVRDAALQGGLLAIFVIFLFLRRFSATAILAVSIPVSLITSFAPMFLSDVTLNIMSLGGLALGVGMLVDSSIVVLEAITRASDEGRDRRSAAIAGVSRVAAAVTASTLTTIAVFFPIVFVEGIAGQLFRDQSLTVVYSLLISLLVALFVIPMLTSLFAEGGLRAGRSRSRSPFRDLPDRRWRKTESRIVRWIVAIGHFGEICSAWSLRACGGVLWLIGGVVRVVLWPLTFVFDRAYRALEAIYPAVLAGSLRLRWVVLLLAIGLLGLAAVRVENLGTELLPEVAQGEFFVDVFLPRDATVERTDAVVAPLELEIAGYAEVASTFLAVGVDKEELNSSEEGEHSARILVRLHRELEAAVAEEAVRVRVRERIRRTPEIVSYRFTRPSVLSFAAPLVVEIVGKDLIALRQVSADVETALRELPGLRDVRSTLQRGNPELVLRLDRDQMSALGLDSGTVTEILDTKVRGDIATLFAERDRKIDMRVAIARSDLDRIDRLMAINVNPAGDPAIPLGSIATVQRLEGPSEIRRLGNSRGAEVQAAVAGFDIGSMQLQVETALHSVPMPTGIEARLGGQREEMERSTASVQMALLLAIFLVYVVMASQFESLVQPFVILLSLPLALIGVVFVLEYTGTPISVLVMLGGIVLAGIVVNNAIIMVDQINKLRTEGFAKRQAILEGATTRLRPVLMTTLTTVLGLLPLTGWMDAIPYMEAGEGVELRAPMAITVVAGLSVSTLLTLIVIPVVYSMSDRRA